MTTATAQSHPNIAFIKYWGNRDQYFRLPTNGSISMNLAGLHTRTRVTFDADLEADELSLDGQPVSGAGLQRVSGFLDLVRQMAGLILRACVDSRNSFPTGAGIASSASAFAALSLAASAAAGLDLSEADLSRLARRGSGSACRSVPGGFVEWQAGESDETSYAFSIAPPDFWELADCIAVVSRAHKPTGSTEGHALAASSPLQASRLADAPRRLEWCRRAILERDFTAFAEVVELDSNLMHAVMMTSTPPLLYWQPATLAVMRSVQDLRKSGLPVCYTIDAGPNVHVICPSGVAPRVVESLEKIPGVENVLTSRPGGPAELLDESLPARSIEPPG
ncbi:MAG TPA: diphosphomevalonate decarboxylase [Anaerolineales bacterium]